MSIFVEVNEVGAKNCKVIINLDHVLEIAPLTSGGCLIYMAAQEAGGTRVMNVSDDYTSFKQFVMQTVTAESISKRFPKTATRGTDNIKPQTTENPGVQLNIPTFGTGEKA